LLSERGILYDAVYYYGKEELDSDLKRPSLLTPEHQCAVTWRVLVVVYASSVKISVSRLIVYYLEESSLQEKLIQGLESGRK
jgi:hypothetical protein